MPYFFAKERPDYSDLASGRVFHSLAGHPAFPIRLASEIFQHCLALRQQDGFGERCALYDPCCGAGYLISTICYLHWPEIKTAIGSDIDTHASNLAGRNLHLLSEAGLSQRLAEISEMIRLYGKETHRDALKSGLVLQEHVRRMAERYPLTTNAFQADALDGNALSAHLADTPIDIVLTDVPYGLRSVWQGAHSGEPTWALLDALRGVLAPGGLVAIAADKQQKIAHARYQRIERFQVGKRRIAIFKPI